MCVTHVETLHKVVTFETPAPGLTGNASLPLEAALSSTAGTADAGFWI